MNNANQRLNTKLSNGLKIGATLVLVGCLSGCNIDVGNFVGAGLQIVCAFFTNVASCP